MIDFNDPTRLELERILFPTAEAVETMFLVMNDSVACIHSNCMSVEPLDVLECTRNKDYLLGMLNWETIKNYGKDLEPYFSVTMM